MAFVYDTTIDPDAPNNSHSSALAMIGYNKSVLEVGCATGYFSKALADRGCKVTGIEVDPDAAAVAEKWLERVVVGDLDAGEVWDDLLDGTYDAVVFGDVLEHLRHPLAALKQGARKVKSSGIVVTSLPNIAHGDVRIALLKGSFTYTESGLLDRTHVTFFTLETARELLRDAGLVVVDTQRVQVPLFHTEIGVKRTDVPDAVLDELLTDPELETYQFVMKSVRDDGTRTTSELANKVAELTDYAHRLATESQVLRQRHIEEIDQRERDAERMQQEAAHQQLAIEQMQLLIDALQQHASGLEHNVEVMTAAHTDSELRYQAVINMKSVQLTAPFRWVHRKIRRGGSARSV